VRRNEHSVCPAARYPVFAMSRLSTSGANRAMTLIEVLIVIVVTAIAAVMTIRLSVP
jgi:prepilin-type N-terminal cleavage/methylation domain-containing protein